MNTQFEKKNYCYFAVDKLIENEFIGFIGLSNQIFESDFLPAVDIGWRLKRNSWGNGYAIEGAKATLDYGFNSLNLDKIISIAPIINQPSINVMKKLQMNKVKEFNHPLLNLYPKIKPAPKSTHVCLGAINL